MNKLFTKLIGGLGCFASGGGLTACGIVLPEYFEKSKFERVRETVESSTMFLKVERQPCPYTREQFEKYPESKKSLLVNCVRL